MEKRGLIAVALSFVVLYSFQALFPPPKPEPGASARGAGPASPSGPGSTSAGAPPASAAEAPPAAAAETNRAATVVGDATEHTISFENDLVRAVFSSRGAVLKSWQLKRYLDAAGKPLELVP